MMDRIQVAGPVRGLHIAVGAFVLSLVLLLAVAGLTAFVLTTRANEAAETHTAICGLVEDLEVRTESTRTFLKTHPRGLPGIASPAVIRDSLRNQERTLAALAAVDC